MKAFWSIIALVALLGIAGGIFVIRQEGQFIAEERAGFNRPEMIAGAETGQIVGAGLSALCFVIFYLSALQAREISVQARRSQPLGIARGHRCFSRQFHLNRPDGAESRERRAGTLPTP